MVGETIKYPLEYKKLSDTQRNRVDTHIANLQIIGHFSESGPEGKMKAIRQASSPEGAAILEQRASIDEAVATGKLKLQALKSSSLEASLVKSHLAHLRHTPHYAYTPENQNELVKNTANANAVAVLLQLHAIDEREKVIESRKKPRLENYEEKMDGYRQYNILLKRHMLALKRLKDESVSNKDKEDKTWVTLTREPAAWIVKKHAEIMHATSKGITSAPPEAATTQEYGHWFVTNVQKISPKYTKSPHEEAMYKTISHQTAQFALHKLRTLDLAAQKKGRPIHQAWVDTVQLGDDEHNR